MHALAWAMAQGQVPRVDSTPPGNPTTFFTPFPRAALEQSIPGRFEAQVTAHPDRLALKTLTQALT